MCPYRLRTDVGILFFYLATPTAALPYPLPIFVANSADCSPPKPLACPPTVPDFPQPHPPPPQTQSRRPPPLPPLPLPPLTLVLACNNIRCRHSCHGLPHSRKANHDCCQNCHRTVNTAAAATCVCVATAATAAAAPLPPSPRHLCSLAAAPLLAATPPPPPPFQAHLCKSRTHRFFCGRRHGHRDGHRGQHCYRRHAGTSVAPPPLRCCGISCCLDCGAPRPSPFPPCCRARVPPWTRPLPPRDLENRHRCHRRYRRCDRHRRLQRASHLRPGDGAADCAAPECIGVSATDTRSGLTVCW